MILLIDDGGCSFLERPRETTTHNEFNSKFKSIHNTCLTLSGSQHLIKHGALHLHRRNPLSVTPSKSESEIVVNGKSTFIALTFIHSFVALAITEARSNIWSWCYLCGKQLLIIITVYHFWGWGGTLKHLRRWSYTGICVTGPLKSKVGIYVSFSNYCICTQVAFCGYAIVVWFGHSGLTFFAQLKAIK